MKVELPKLGEETERGLISALSDLFGPSFQEVGQYLADKVRFHRARAMHKILLKARTLSPDERLEPPNLKFMVPFMEAASLEDDTDDTLVEMWARLLVSASKGADSRHVLFRRILQEITRDEVDFLNKIVLENRGDTRITSCSSFPADAQYYMRRDFMREFLSNCLHRGLEPNQIAAEFVRSYEGAGVLTSHVGVYMGSQDDEVFDELEGDEISGTRHPLESKYSHSIQLLKALNIFDEFKFEPIWVGNVMIEGHVLYMTSLGADFYTTCTGVVRAPFIDDE